MLQKVQQLLLVSRLSPFIVAYCTTIGPKKGDFAANGPEILYETQLQAAN